jgi:hypothetical protein
MNVEVKWLAAMHCICQDPRSVTGLNEGYYNIYSH